MASGAPSFTPSPATAPDSLPRAALALANVLYEKKGSIAYVTVNRPKLLNALNTPTWTDLHAAFEDAKADASVRGLILTGGERDGENIARGAKGGGEQSGERLFGDGELVGGNRETAFGDVEDATGGATVARRIVQNALRDAVRAQIGRRKAGGVRGKRHGAGQAGAVEDKGAGGQARRAARRTIGEIRVEKRLNAGVGGTQIFFEQAFLFVVMAQERLGDLQEASVRGIL